MSFRVISRFMYIGYTDAQKGLPSAYEPLEEIVCNRSPAFFPLTQLHRAVCEDFRRQIRDLDTFISYVHNKPFDDVFELSHVARPRIVGKDRQRLR